MRQQIMEKDPPFGRFDIFKQGLNAAMWKYICRVWTEFSSMTDVQTEPDALLPGIQKRSGIKKSRGPRGFIRQSAARNQTS